MRSKAALNSVCGTKAFLSNFKATRNFQNQFSYKWKYQFLFVAAESGVQAAGNAVQVLIALKFQVKFYHTRAISAVAGKLESPSRF